MSEQELFIKADQALNGVVQKIHDEQWDIAIPDWFQVGRKQKNMTLKTIINYHAYDDAWVPDILAGKTMAESGTTKYDGDLLRTNPKASFAQLVEKAVAAVRALKDPERTVRLSYGDFTAKVYLQHITGFRGLRVYDIAKLIGAETTLPTDLVQGLWDQILPHAEEWRAMGVFGPQIQVPDNADLQTKLLALTGRKTF